MKKLFKSIATAIAACALVAVFALVGCSDSKLSGQMKVIIAADEQTKVEYTVDLQNFTSSSRVSDVIIYLSTHENLYYKGTTSAYGIYLTELGTTELKHDEQGDYDYEVKNPIIAEKYYADNSGMEYISVYTSVSKNTAYTQTLNYDDIRLGYASAGISSLNIENGAVVYFTLTQYLY